MFLTEEDEIRFWSGIDVRGADDCWNWGRSCTVEGCGKFGLNKTWRLAHRVVWEIVNEEIPELFKGVPTQVCHSCDNPPCCNPRHLFLGNGKLNRLDSVKKGRISKGANHPFACLTEIEVLEIRKEKKSQKEIAEKFGVVQIQFLILSLVKLGVI